MSKVNIERILNFNKISSKKVPLRTWLESLISHFVVIPEFQRPVVWPSDKVTRLLNSIFGGFYIGNFLVFKPENIHKFKYHPLKGVKDCKTNQKGEIPSLLLLDGQQRSFSLLYGLCGLWEKNISLPEGTVSRNPYLFLVGLKNLLECNYDKIILGVPFNSSWKRRNAVKEFFKENEDRVVPTSIFSSFVKEEDVLRKYKLSLSPEDLEIILELKKKILEYPIMITVLEFADDLVGLEKAFEVINTPGLPLSTFDLLVAKLLNSNFDLRLEVKNLKKTFKPLIPGETDEEEISIKLEDKLLVEPLLLLTNKSSLLELEKEDFDLYWGRVKESTKELAEFLESRLGVWDINNLLPYSGLVPVLIAVLYFLNYSFKTKTEKELKKLEIWYWSIVLQQKLRDASNISQKKKLFEELKRWVEKEEVPQVVKSFNLEKINISIRYSKTSALAKAILNIFYLNSPRDFLTGQTPREYGKDIIDIDHIFPKSVYKSKANVLSNLTLLPLTTNRQKKNKKPSEFFSEVQNLYSPKEWEIILHSHFINKKAFEALLEDDLDTFKIEREKEIKRKIAEIFSL